MCRSRLAPVLSLLAVAFLVSATPAIGDEAQEISRMMKQGQQDKALERANAYLATHAKDAQVRFMKGLILTEENKTADAIKVFTGITEDYPELPEPYNNLAVLYASQGQYEKAKIALEMAINTHPSYATAHENLGDIYAKMASQAYDKALQLDKGNTNAQAKLALVREIFSKQDARQPARPAALAASTVPVAPKAPAAAAPAAAPVVAAAPAPAAKPPVAEPLKPVAPPPAEKPAPAAKPAAGEKAAPEPAKEDDSEAVLAAVHAWAKAWSAKNAAAYLKSYAPDLVLAKGEIRADWEETRKERISKPKSISVKVASVSVSMTDSGHAKVTFKQVYRSPSLNSETWKTLSMVKSGGRWLIHEERIGR